MRVCRCTTECAKPASQRSRVCAHQVRPRLFYGLALHCDDMLVLLCCVLPGSHVQSFHFSAQLICMVHRTLPLMVLATMHWSLALFPLPTCLALPLPLRLQPHANHIHQHTWTLLLIHHVPLPLLLSCPSPLLLISCLHLLSPTLFLPSSSQHLSLPLLLLICHLTAMLMCHLHHLMIKNRILRTVMSILPICNRRSKGSKERIGDISESRRRKRRTEAVRRRREGDLKENSVDIA